MESISNKFLDEIKSEVSELESEYGNILELQNKKVEKKEKYTNYWRLKEISGELKFKYRLLDSWSKSDYKNYVNKYICREIYYFEKCFLMLKDLYDPKYIYFQHYLKSANLEFEYFFEGNNSYPKEFIKDSFDIQGITDDFRINLILNNFKKAQENLKLIIDNINDKSNDPKELFLYYEVLGDLYLHVFIIIKKSRSGVERVLDYLNQGYYYYLVSNKYKESVERQNPATSYDGLHGWEVFKIFVEFFKEIGTGNIHNVRLKLEFLEHNYLSNTEISRIKREVKGDFQ